MITKGTHLLINANEKGEDQVWFRVVVDYDVNMDAMVARFDVLANINGRLKQFNSGFELSEPKLLPMPKGLDGFSTSISKKTLRNILLGFADKLKD